MLEAARIDGANHWQLYWRIMASASALILGALAILHFMGASGTTIWPLVVATERSIQPIMVVLPNLRDLHIGFFAGLGDDHGRQRFGDPADRDGVRRLQDKFMSSVVIGAVKEIRPNNAAASRFSA